MVMQSVFDTNLSIHERFDLKGSWVGRLVGRQPTGTLALCKFCAKEFYVGGSHNQNCSEGRHMYDNVGKDLNWNRHMALPTVLARRVARQLSIDSQFLSQINCIDYSLLVGIHHRSFQVSHPDSNHIGNGMEVVQVHGPGVYYLGLIDILQQVTLKNSFFFLF